MIDDSVFQFLTDDERATAVQALIATRLYPLLLPESPILPAGTYQLISNIEQNTLADGAVNATARLQMDIWAKTLLEAKTIAKAIRAVLNRFAGQLPSGTNVSNAWLDSQGTSFDDVTELYRLQMDWMIVHDDV